MGSEDIKTQIRWVVFSKWGDAIDINWTRRDVLRQVEHATGEPWKTLHRKYGMFVAKAAVGPIPVTCGVCDYAENPATVSGGNELHEPGTTVYSCRNGVCWYKDDPDMNPSWFGCSLGEHPDRNPGQGGA